MKVTTTPAGDLKIRVEHGAEWLLLSSVVRDARAGEFDPAASVGARTTDEQMRAEWAEWVEPDLRQGFDHQLEAVAAAVAKARGMARGKTLLASAEWVVPKADFAALYGALNQARLALEAKYGLAENPPEEEAEEAAPDERWSAYLRSQFYLFLQSRLLDAGLG